MSTAAGWYPNGDQWETYWDGEQWADRHRPVGKPAGTVSPVQSHVQVDSESPLLEFTSHIEGKNAIVSIYPDRVEWLKPRGVSGAKVTAGIMTAGLSMLATGVKSGDAGTEMVPIRSISSVTTRRDGFLNTIVSVIASGNTVDFRIAHKEAERVKDTLTQLIRGSHESQRNGGESKSSAPVVVNVAPSAAVPAAAGAGATAPPAAPDVAAQLHQLGGLRDAGILTEDEFVTKKSELLARL